MIWKEGRQLATHKQHTQSSTPPFFWEKHVFDTMPRKILLATEKPFTRDAVGKMGQELAKHPGFEMVPLEGYTNKQDLLTAIADADAVIFRSDKLTKDVFEAAPKLKIAVRAGAGYDNVDIPASQVRVALQRAALQSACNGSICCNGRESIATCCFPHSAP